MPKQLGMVVRTCSKCGVARVRSFGGVCPACAGEEAAKESLERIKPARKPSWRCLENERWRLHCGVAEGVVSDILPIGGKKHAWRVDVNGAFGMLTPCKTIEEGKLACEKAIRELIKEIKEGLGE